MALLQGLLFALAVSLDGLGVGVAYGMRGIRLPLVSLLIISLSSALAISVSMFFGRAAAGLFAPGAGEKVGGFIIMMVAVYFIFQAVKGQKNGNGSRRQRRVFRLNLESFGIIIEVLRKPASADLDRSGTICHREALVLGFALAMDALGAGFGAAVAGFELWLTPLLVAVCKILLISLGLRAGKAMCIFAKGRIVQFLPGLIMFILGVTKM